MAQVDIVPEHRYRVACDRCQVYRLDRSSYGPLQSLTVPQRTTLSEYIRTHQLPDSVMLTAENVLTLAGATS
ncbi:MAG: hypothetical protein ACO1Q7_00985 [Gemmatimonas sp.]